MSDDDEWGKCCVHSHIYRRTEGCLFCKDGPAVALIDLTADQQREIVKQDLLGKFQREDWHGVMDAAVDLREHDAYWKGKSGG